MTSRPVPTVDETAPVGTPAPSTPSEESVGPVEPQAPTRPLITRTGPWGTPQVTGLPETLPDTGQSFEPRRQWFRTPDRLEVDHTQDYERVQTAMWAHLGASTALPAEALGPLAKAFVDRFAEEEPALLAAVDRDARWLAALTDDEILNLFQSGGSLAPETGEVLEVFTEVAYEAGLGELYEQTVLAREAEARDGWNRLVGQDVIDLRAQVGEAARRLAAKSDDPNAQVFADQIEGDITWAVTEIFDKPTVWQTDGDNLVFEVAGDQGIQLLGVKLDPGTRITNSMDAIRELLLAKSGLAHDFTSGKERIADRPGVITRALDAVSRAVEESPTARAAADKALGISSLVLPMITGQGVTPEDITEAWKGQPFTTAAFKDEEGRQRLREQAAANVVAGGQTTEAVRTAVAMATAQLAWDIQENGLTLNLDGQQVQTMGLDLDLALQAARDLLDLNPEVRQLIETTTSDEVLELAEQQLEDQTVLGAAIEKGVNAAFTALTKWDDITQKLAVSAVDFLADSVAAITPVDEWVLAGAESDTDLTEGSGFWVKAFEETNVFQTDDAANVAEYFGLDGAAADTALLTAGVVFDPLNYLFGGAKFASKLARQMITSERFAPLYVKTFGRGLVNDLYRREGIDGLRVVASMGGHTPESLRDFVRIAKASPARAGKAAKPFTLRLEEYAPDPLILKQTDHMQRFFGEGQTPYLRAGTDEGGEFLFHGDFKGGSPGPASGLTVSPIRAAHYATSGGTKKGGRILVYRADDLPPSVQELRGIKNGYTPEGNLDIEVMRPRERWSPKGPSDEELAGLTPVGYIEADEVMEVLKRGDSIDSVTVRPLEARAPSPEGTVTRAEVEEVVMRYLPGTDGVGFLMLGTADRARVHQFANAIAATVDKIPTLDANTATQVWQSLAKLSKGRSMSLSPSVFIDEFLDIVATVHRGDSDALATWMQRLADSMENATVGRHEWQALAQTRLEDASQQIRTLEDELELIAGVNRQGGSITSLDEELNSIRKAMKNRRGAKLSGDEEVARKEALDALRRQKRAIEGQRKTELARKNELTEELRKARKEVISAERELGYAMSANANTAQAKLVAEFYDDLARNIQWIDENGTVQTGLRVVRPDPVYAGLHQYDWTPVTGGSNKIRPFQESPVTSIEGISANPEIAQSMNELGVFNKQSVAPIPASPYEIVVYQRIVEGMSGSRRERALAAWRHSRTKETVRGLYSAYRKAFAVNLLMNATTPMVTNLDEVLRFWAVSGDLGQTARAVAAPFGLGPRNVSGRTQQYQRDVLGDLVAGHDRWQWVHRPAKVRETKQGGYLDQVERFVNGQIIQDDILQAWGRAQKLRQVEYVDDMDSAVQWWKGKRAAKAPESFVDWWENGGSANYRNWLIDRDGGRAMTVDEVFARLDNGIRYWMGEFVDSPVRGKFQEKLVDVLAEGGQFHRTKDAALLRAVNRVPGVQAVRDGGSVNKGLDWTFDFLYGKPGQRRGAIFYDHFYEETYQVLREAYDNKGTLLTADRLADEINKGGGVGGRMIDVEEARMMLSQAFDDPAVATLLRGGFVTEATLEAQAARQAARRSDELMYSLASTSLWGETGEAAFPFLRAQTDFIAWWWKHLTSPAVMRLGPEARSLPVLKQLSSAVESIPLNIRAMAKYSHMAAAYNNAYDPEGDTLGTPQFALDKLTFFPLVNSGEIMMDIMPSPLGVVSWLAMAAIDNMEEIPDEWRTAAEELWPALQWSSTGNPLNAEMLFPASERSTRNQAGALIRLLAALFEDENDGDFNASFAAGLASWLTTQRQASGTTTAQAVEFIDFLRSPEANLGPPPDRETGEEWVALVTPYAQRGAIEAAKSAGIEAIKGQVKLSEVYGGDAPYLEAYRVIIDNWDLLHQYPGLLPKNMTLDEGGEERLLRIWNLWQSGEADDEEIRFLADSLATLSSQQLSNTPLIPSIPEYSIREYLMAQDRALAVNAVSKLQITEGLDLRGGKASEFYRNYSGPENRLTGLPPGEDGLAIRREALDRGWLTSRPTLDWFEDAHGFSDSAIRNTVKAAWQLLTGREWSRDSTYRWDGDDLILESGVSREDENGVPLRNRTVSFETRAGMQAKHLLEVAGVELEPDILYTVDSLRRLLDERVETLAPGPMAYTQVFSTSQLARQIKDNGGAAGQEMLRVLRSNTNTLDKFGYENVDDWPESVKDWTMAQLKTARDLGWFTDSAYRASAERLFGDLDWEPPVPPPESELEAGWRIDDKDLIGVSDGDTLSLVLPDGNLRVRLLGINAPETGTGPEAIQATESLIRAIERADTVTLGFYKPEVFGTQQSSAPGVTRLVAWLYINGVPVYDENLFTARNQTGAGLGGEYVDIWELYERRK